MRVASLGCPPHTRRMHNYSCFWFHGCLHRQRNGEEADTPSSRYNRDDAEYRRRRDTDADRDRGGSRRIEYREEDRHDRDRTRRDDAGDRDSRRPGNGYDRADRYDRGDRYGRGDRHDRLDRYDRHDRNGRRDDRDRGHEGDRWTRRGEAGGGPGDNALEEPKAKIRGRGAVKYGKGEDWQHEPAAAAAADRGEPAPDQRSTGDAVAAAAEMTSGTAAEGAAGVATSADGGANAQVPAAPPADGAAAAGNGAAANATAQRKPAPAGMGP